MTHAEPLRFGACRLHPRVAASLPGFCAALGARIAEECGRPVVADVRPSYEELLAAFLEGKLELGWMPPLLLARALAAGATLLAIPLRAGAMTYRSAILVRAGGELRALQDLRDRRAAWVDRASASGYLFPRLELLQRHGFDPERPFSSEMFHGATVRAAAAVAAGEADFCACFVTEGAASDPAQGKADLSRALGPLAERLRPLHIGAPIPPDGLVAPAQLQEPLRQSLARSLVSLHETERGETALQALLQAARLREPPGEVASSLAAWSAPA